LTLAPAAGIRVAQALQVSTSVAYLPAEAWAFEAGAFLRRREESAGPSDFTGDGLIFRPRTRNYGFEVLLRKRNVGRLYGWLSYTLSWARQDELEAPFETYTDSFDQRHNLAVVASYSLPRRWRIGGRFRLVSGVPYTPIVGVLDIPGGPSLTKTLPLYGSPNTARFPLFHQLDLRVDKRWYARRVIITLYLDVQNVYNHQNVELYRYSPDYRRREASLGLPIFPSIGVRIDY
jgi:hypothetical protein